MAGGTVLRSGEIAPNRGSHTREVPATMPELPEVETIANGLHRRVAGDRIESVWVGSKPEPLKSPAAEISGALAGARVERVRRVGKHIVFDLQSSTKQDGSQWIVHLGMTGRMLVS